MDAFLRDAQEILDTAVAASRPGAQEFAIVVDRLGTIRMIEPAGWMLPALAAEFGARAAYRVRREGRIVRVDGWSAARSCTLSQELPLSTAYRHALQPPLLACASTG